MNPPSQPRGFDLSTEAKENIFRRMGRPPPPVSASTSTPPPYPETPQGGYSLPRRNYVHPVRTFHEQSLSRDTRSSMSQEPKESNSGHGQREKRGMADQEDLGRMRGEKQREVEEHETDKGTSEESSVTLQQHCQRIMEIDTGLRQLSATFDAFNEKYDKRWQDVQLNLRNKIHTMSNIAIQRVLNEIRKASAKFPSPEAVEGLQRYIQEVMHNLPTPDELKSAQNNPTREDFKAWKTDIADMMAKMTDSIIQQDVEAKLDSMNDDIHELHSSLARLQNDQQQRDLAFQDACKRSLQSAIEGMEKAYQRESQKLQCDADQKIKQATEKHQAAVDEKYEAVLVEMTKKMEQVAKNTVAETTRNARRAAENTTQKAVDKADEQDDGQGGEQSPEESDEETAAELKKVEEELRAGRSCP